jgi:hypothetical protein
MARVRPSTRRGNVVAWVITLAVLAALAGGIAWLVTSQRKGQERVVNCTVTEKGHDEEGEAYIETTECGSMSVPSEALPWEDEPLDGLRVGHTYRVRIVETHRPLGLSSTEVVKVEGEVRG